LLLEHQGVVKRVKMVRRVAWLKYFNTITRAGQWIPISQKLTGWDSIDWFGDSLSINTNGDTIAIGTGYGIYVEVFHLKNEKWEQFVDAISCHKGTETCSGP